MAVNVNNDHSRAAFFNFTVLSLGKIIRYIIPINGKIKTNSNIFSTYIRRGGQPIIEAGAGGASAPRGLLYACGGLLYAPPYYQGSGT